MSGTWVLTIAGTIFTFCCFGFATYISLYWAQTFFGGDMNQSNWWVSIMYAIEIPIVILIGWLLNHIKLKNRRYVGVLGFLLYTFILFFCFRMDRHAARPPGDRLLHREFRMGSCHDPAGSCLGAGCDCVLLRENA